MTLPPLPSSCSHQAELIVAGVPGVQIHAYADYGQTVSAFNPQTNRALFIQRVDRDKNPVEIYCMDDRVIPYAISYLLGENPTPEQV